MNRRKYLVKLARELFEEAKREPDREKAIRKATRVLIPSKHQPWKKTDLPSELIAEVQEFIVKKGGAISLEANRSRFRFTNKNRRAIMRYLFLVLLHVVTVLGPFIIEFNGVFLILTFGVAFVVGDGLHVRQPIEKKKDWEEFEKKTAIFAKNVIYLYIYGTLGFIALFSGVWVLNIQILLIHQLYLMFSSFVLGLFWGTGTGFANSISDYVFSHTPDSWKGIIMIPSLMILVSILGALWANISILVPLATLTLTFLIMTLNRWEGQDSGFQIAANTGFFYAPFTAILLGILVLFSRGSLAFLLFPLPIVALAIGSGGLLGILVSSNFLQSDSWSRNRRRKILDEFYRFIHEVSSEIFVTSKKGVRADWAGVFFACLPFIPLTLFLVLGVVEILSSFILFSIVFSILFVIFSFRSINRKLLTFRETILAFSFLFELFLLVPAIVIIIIVSFIFNLGTAIIFNIAGASLLILTAVFLSEYVTRNVLNFTIAIWSRLQMYKGFAVIKHTREHRYGFEYMLFKVPLNSTNIQYKRRDELEEVLAFTTDNGTVSEWDVKNFRSGGLLEINHLLFCTNLEKFGIGTQHRRIRGNENNYIESLTVLPPKKWIPPGLHSLRTKVRDRTFMNVSVDSTAMKIPKLENLEQIRDWQNVLEEMSVSARSLSDIHRRVQNAWILEVFGLTRFWDQAYDTLKIVTKLARHVGDVDLLKSELADKLIARLESHLKKRRSTHFLEIERLEREPTHLRFIPDIVKYREAEFKSVTLIQDKTTGNMDLRPLWLTARGFSILSKTGLGHVTTQTEFQEVSEVLRSLGVQLKIKIGKINQAKLPKTWTRMSKTQKKFILYLARPELRRIL